jgi:hypothetical protein
MTAVKHFTPADANRTLPLVKRIVADILETGTQIRKLTATPSKVAASNEFEMRKLVSELESLMRELEQIGCQYKDWNFKVGLVDFPAVIDGQEVLLCWRSDEPEILHYHGVNEGYVGRKAIPEALV